MKYSKIDLPYRMKTETLALGAQSKSAFCFTRGNTAYLSDPQGDLSDLRNFEIFERQIKDLQRKLKIKPHIVACDLHPEYISTKYALQMNSDKIRIRQIQHHQAHVASCIADNQIKGRVIGAAFDGAGYGLDGNIWGGEFFIGDIKGLRRIAYLRYISMPGGESAIKEQWRMSLSYLYSVYGNNFRKLDIDFISKLDKEKTKLLIQIMNKKINSPLTSSIGRLFDAVSSLIGISSFAAYEGEAAIKLEKMIGYQTSGINYQDRYRFRYEDKKGIIIIDWKPLIQGIVKDLRQGLSGSAISLAFHSAICRMIEEICILLRRKYKISKICLSGGVFQNRYLNANIKTMLKLKGFEAYLHNNIPANDGGIPVGQAVLAGV